MIKTSFLMWKIGSLLLLLVFIIGAVSCIYDQPQTPINSGPTPKISPLTFTVTPSQPEIVTVPINDGDTIKVVFSVKGGSGNDVDFSMKDPAGKFIFPKLKVSENFSRIFDNLTSGTYQLIFENKFSIFTSKKVNLTTIIYPKQ